MGKFLLRRTGQAIAVLFGVSIIVFVMIHLLPGGPARAMLGDRATPAKIAAFNRQYGYNRPVVVQYIRWLANVLQGNLGFSAKLNEPVTALIGQRLPGTALLVGLANLFALLLAIPIGMVQAFRRNRLVDYLATGLSFIFYSMPIFWLGLILVILFAVQLHVFPPIVPQASLGQLIADPADIALPVITLTLVTIALFSRYIRSSTIESLTQDWVRSVRAKGFKEVDLAWRHVLRNSVGPVVTLVGLTLPVVVGGAVVVESVFNYPGMGLLLWNAAQDEDYPVILGVTLVVAVATVIGSFLADVLYAVIDPRVRVQ
jgi:peptide/nickel transport system permease protein